MDSPAIIDLATTARRLADARRIVITTHLRADGDAVASTAALLHLLGRAGASASAYVHEAVSPRYRFLPGTERLEVWPPAGAASILSSCGLLVVLDTCARSQLGDVADAIAAAPCRRLAIDHHVTRDAIVHEICVDERAAACAQIVAALCDVARWPLDKRTATLLFAGLATDTGWFRFSNADCGAYVAAAKLIEAGATPDELYEKLYQSDPPARARLIGAVLSSCELLAGGRLAVVRLTRRMIESCGATDQMTEELVNEPQRVAGVDTCVLFAEPAGAGPVRVSLRSKGLLDVAEIAARFGGGGHPRAAGARLKGTMDSVSGQVIPLVVEALGAALLTGEEPTGPRTARS